MWITCIIDYRKKAHHLIQLHQRWSELKVNGLFICRSRTRTKYQCRINEKLTGNDKIIARALFKEPVEFSPQFKMLLMCNDLPNIPSNDDGTWRRLEVVDFVSRFVGKDDYHKLDDSKHVYKRDKRTTKQITCMENYFLWTPVRRMDEI